MVDAQVSKTCGPKVHEGSSPSLGTRKEFASGFWLVNFLQVLYSKNSSK